MYAIALCDDEAVELDKTERLIQSYGNDHPGIDFKIERFDNADELLYMISEKNYMPDLIIMDIYMPDKLGIEAARELRDEGNRSRIVFLTTSREHALDAFGVEAAQYLLKPVSRENLYPMLDRFLEETEEERSRYLLLRIDGRIRRVPVNDIVFCEAQGKTQYLHCVNGSQCVLHMTMGEVSQMLETYDEFVRIGVAYVVNMEHLESISRQELILDNGKKIYPPRGAYQALRERYFGYYCEE